MQSGTVDWISTDYGSNDLTKLITIALCMQCVELYLPRSLLELHIRRFGYTLSEKAIYPWSIKSGLSSI